MYGTCRRFFSDFIELHSRAPVSVFPSVAPLHFPIPSAADACANERAVGPQAHGRVREAPFGDRAGREQHLEDLAGALHQLGVRRASGQHPRFFHGKRENTTLVPGYLGEHALGGFSVVEIAPRVGVCVSGGRECSFIACLGFQADGHSSFFETWRRSVRGDRGVWSVVQHTQRVVPQLMMLSVDLGWIATQRANHDREVDLTTTR